jgi:hypothetical protein
VLSLQIDHSFPSNPPQPGVERDQTLARIHHMAVGHA